MNAALLADHRATCIRAYCRTASFAILSLLVSGRDSTNRTCRGRLNAAIRDRTWAASTSADDRDLIDVRVTRQRVLHFA
jgi:hypothetical protein